MKENLKRSMTGIGLLILVCIFGMEVARAGGEYDFSWLDPDKKIYVLQNRRYSKLDRVLLSLMGGMARNNAYRKSYTADFRAAYYFREEWGFEFLYQNYFNQKSSTFKALEQSSQTFRPDVTEIQNQIAALVHYVPWYAKINMFDEIIYFDWYFAAGLGRIGAKALPGSSGIAGSNTSYTGLYLGTGHQFHFDDHWGARLDVMNTWFRAPLRAVAGAQTWFTTTSFEVGVTYRL